MSVVGFKDFILFLERGEGREKGRETPIDCLSRYATSRDWAHSAGLGPDREPNQRTFALWYDAQPREPRQTGLPMVGFKETGKLQKGM